jgi:hypothetical protein
MRDVRFFLSNLGLIFVDTHNGLRKERSPEYLGLGLYAEA